MSYDEQGYDVNSWYNQDWKNIWYATCHTGFMYVNITCPRWYERNCVNIKFSYPFDQVECWSLSLVMGFNMKPYTNGCHEIGGICRIHGCIYNK
jgi:hypothetical protein